MFTISSYRSNFPVMILLCVRPNDIAVKLVITSILTEHKHLHSKVGKEKKNQFCFYNYYLAVFDH